MGGKAKLSLSALKKSSCTRARNHVRFVVRDFHSHLSDRHEREGRDGRDFNGMFSVGENFSDFIL